MKSPETSGRAFYCRCIVFCMGTKANDESIADHHPGLIPPSSLDRSWVDMQRVSPINVIFDFETLRGIAWRTKPRKAKLLAVHRPKDYWEWHKLQLVQPLEPMRYDSDRTLYWSYFSSTFEAHHG